MMNVTGYTLANVIQEGRTSTMHRAVRDADGAHLVLKISSDISARSQAALRHELGILQDLDLPGVPRAHALEKHSEYLALVLGPIEGSRLSELLSRGPLDIRSAVHIAAALAWIVQGVHERGIILKDIQPEQIFVHPSTHRVHIVGFRIATRLSHEAQRVVSPDALEGNLAYMSPEQTGRMNRFIDRRTDLYSLGVTLYEMLTGLLPFSAIEPMELVHCHIARVPVPPHERSRDVPEAISRIVMKLLSKNAEDRYQSARGVAMDLEECASQLGATSTVAVFPLARHDTPDTLRVPEKLYGRVADVKNLLSAFERSEQGNAELFIVSGYSGIGKSALVHEIHKAIAHGGGYFAAGKFDQLGRRVPYAPLADAFSDLIRQILGEPEPRILEWKERFGRALGNNGRLISDLVPELAIVTGPQPELPALGPAEAQNRFNLAFKNFVGVFADAKHPLVLFLDDLQWIDPSSLKLLDFLLDEPRCPHLLLIVAYRDNEVDAGHPLRASLDSVRRGGANVTEACLAPLALDDVVEMLAEALGDEREAILPLARVISDRTHNNPFFVRQFLRALHDERLICFDKGRHAWSWNIEAIRSRPSTENVVEFMVLKIRDLPPDVRCVLKLAACIGHQFDLRTLSLVHERSPEETAAALWDALAAGLVLPVDVEYRLVHGAGPLVQPAAADAALRVRYRFVHDRVQQAAYSLVGGEERRQLHLALGRLLLASQGESLFDVVNHLNLGASLISDPTERARLAELNLRAGEKAKAASAYESALGHFRLGMDLLAEGSWRDRYEVTLALHRERAEAEYLNGHFAEAERLCSVAVANARTAMDKVRIHFVQTSQYQLQGRYGEAIAIQREGLSLLGWRAPEGPDELDAALKSEMDAAARLLAGRPIEELIHAPKMKSPEHLAMLELLQLMLYTAYVDDQKTLANLSLAKMTTVSIEYGNSEFSPFGYVGYSMVLDALLDDFELGYRFAKTGIELSEQFDNPAIRCKVNFLFAADVHSWTQPLKKADLYYERAYRYGIESGDWVTVGYMIIQSGSDRLTRGMPLAELERICEAQIAFLERAKNQDVIDLLKAGVLQPMRNLEGRTESRSTFDGEGFIEAAYLEKYGHSAYYEAWLQYAKIRSVYLFDERARFAELVQKLDVVLLGVPTHAKVPETTFYAALMRIALYEDAEAAGKEAHLAELEKLEERLSRWARCAPANISHKLLLVQAERARVEGRRLEAMDLYEKSIALARENDYLNNQALANELYGRFWLAQGRGEIAAVFLQNALHLYEKWGALAKVAHLRERHAGLLTMGTTAALARPAPREAPESSPSDASVERLDRQLDWTTILQAGHAMSSEVELEKVLDRLLRIVLSNAGATRGALILARDGRLFVEATMVVDPDVVTVGPSVPVEERADLPVTIVHYVARAREAVVIGDAADDLRFTVDPYIAARRPRSILCVALLHQGKLVGVLYLENHLAERAFGEGRAGLVELLSAHAAVAVQNAMLYDHLQSASAEVRSKNEQLARELDERQRAEASRMALQDEVIRMQREQLIELSTPIIPVTDRVMVMPLVGSMDKDRAAQVLDTALRGASERGASVVILDVTGLRKIDASVVATLVQAANALRLLGAEAVLTGVRPNMAGALIDVGANLAGLVTKGTLQSGISYAVRQTREKLA